MWRGPTGCWLAGRRAGRLWQLLFHYRRRLGRWLGDGAGWCRDIVVHMQGACHVLCMGRVVLGGIPGRVTSTVQLSQSQLLLTSPCTLCLSLALSFLLGCPALLSTPLTFLCGVM